MISSRRLRNTAFQFISLAVAVSTATAEPVRETYWYQSSITQDDDGPLDLVAELNYNDDDDDKAAQPIIVVMHGFSPSNGNLSNVRSGAERLRDDGFFAISVAMRDRDGSDGQRDSSGIEIWDIVDAVESVIDDYPELVDPSNISIVGFSGGGGNTMATLTKFPDYFNLGASFFGMSDYGYDPDDAWWYRGSSSSHRSIMSNDVGNPTSGDPAVLDRYQARAHALASHNNPYTEIHLFHNFNETICPPINHFRFNFNAESNESFPGEFDNITIHEGGLGNFVDFDGDGINDPDELQSWPHTFPSANQQNAAQGHYIDRLIAGEIPKPVLNSGDQLVVAGFVSTRPFTIFVGDGQDAAASADYEVIGNAMRLDARLLGLLDSHTVTLRFNTTLSTDDRVHVYNAGEPTGILTPDDDGQVETAIPSGQEIFLVPVFDGADAPNAATLDDLRTPRDDVNGSGLTGELEHFVNSIAVDTCPFDYDGDGTLTFIDVSRFLTYFVTNDDRADLTGEGVIDFADVSAFLAGFAAGCP